MIWLYRIGSPSAVCFSDPMIDRKDAEVPGILHNLSMCESTLVLNTLLGISPDRSDQDDRKNKVRGLMTLPLCTPAFLASNYDSNTCQAGRLSGAPPIQRGLASFRQPASLLCFNRDAWHEMNGSSPCLIIHEVCTPFICVFFSETAKFSLSFSILEGCDSRA